MGDGRPPSVAASPGKCRAVALRQGSAMSSHALPMNVAPSTTNTESSCITARFGMTCGGTGNGSVPSDCAVWMTPLKSSCGAPPSSPWISNKCEPE